MKREIKLYLFTLLLGWAIKFLPKDAKKTWNWIAEMPVE